MNRNKKKSVLIVINNSLGELDWIFPYLKQVAEKQLFEFKFYFSFVGFTRNAKISFLEMYGFSEANLWSSRSFIFDLIESLIFRINHRFGYFDNILKFLLNKNYFLPDSIFIESNCIESPILRLLDFSGSKFFVFPHSLNLKPHLVKRDWLKNKDVCFLITFCDLPKIDVDNFIHWYPRGNIVEVGVPQLQRSKSLKQWLFKPVSKRILFITRPLADCELYGFTSTDAIDIYNESISYFLQRGYEVHVKHHPRDRTGLRYQDFDSPNFKILDIPLSLLVDSYSFSIGFFSSAPIILTSYKIPHFDISPYSSTVDFSKIFFETQKVIPFEILLSSLNCRYLNDISDFQYERLLFICLKDTSNLIYHNMC